MKEDMMRRAIGGIDPRLVEAADAAPRKKRGVTVKKIVAIALAVMVTTFGLLMLNAQVRAAVLGVFIGTDSEGNTVVRFGENEENGTTDLVDVNDVIIGYVPEGLTAEEITGEDKPEDYRFIQMKNSNDPSVYAEVRIMSAGLYDTIFSPGSFDYFSPTTVNGMDAFYMDKTDYMYSECGGQIVFGDGKINISVSGYNISMDELRAIAESVSW